ncbi:hypothetical protein N855_gp64 [Mycobacterium phage Muddy]|uniref:Uncharacterized protein n=2 Tax=Mycobacterium phage Muddy TaxID=1340829 RepID=A0ACD4QAD1_9CAUD|nr:hypothetical protein N855_gp64 [Mycobacterium phage Muddy]WEV84108.1 hypothetical protein PBI_MUDDY_64 [Mycobacterium phage Muddy]
MSQPLADLILPVKTEKWEASVVDPSSDDYNAVKALTDRIQYKVDWWFNVELNYMLGYTALKIISAPVIDSYHPERGVQARVEMLHPVPVGFATWSEKRQVCWFKECIRSMEHHEMDEWLKIDGVMIHDPHSGKNYDDAN